MAYNTSKGPRNLGDIANENDTDTQIDFGSDSITLKTNNVERLSISNSEVSSSVHFVASSLSASTYISASEFYGDGSTLSNLPSPGISWDGSTANGVATYKDSDEATVEPNLTFDGSTLTIAGNSVIDKNHTTTDGATITGLQIDFDKTGASTSDNTMYGIQLDMDNTTATNGNNYMYGLHVTPTLTHAADAGATFVYGALINAQGGTNGSSLVQAARFEAGGGDVNYGIQLDVEDGGVDLRIESSADNGDYFQIQTTTHGATTITTVDDDATAAHLTFNVDGDITLDPAGGNVVIDGDLSASINVSASAFYGSGIGLEGIPADALTAPGGNTQIVYNDNGSLAATSNFIFDASEATPLVATTGNLSASFGVSGSALETADTVINKTHFSSSLNVSGAAFYGDGSTLSNVASVGGATGEIQFNNAGSLDGSGRLTFDTSEHELILTGSLEVHSGSVSPTRVFQVESDADGKGRMKARQTFVMHHNMEFNSQSKRFITMTGQATHTATTTEQTTILMPYNGRLLKLIYMQAETPGASSNDKVEFGIYSGSATSGGGGTPQYPSAYVDSTTNPGGQFTASVDTPRARYTIDMQALPASSGSFSFSAGDMVAISMDPDVDTNPGDTFITTIWEYDLFNEVT